jgi:hypothetical protein
MRDGVADRLDRACASFETAASQPPQDDDISEAIKNFRHAEERLKGASRSTHRVAAACLPDLAERRDA